MLQPKQIQPQSVAQEFVVVSNDGCVDVEPLHISSLEMEMSSENDIAEMNAVHNGNEDIPLVEELLIENHVCNNVPNTDTNDTLETGKQVIETPIADFPALTNTQTDVIFIKCEEPDDDFKNKAIKQELQEP